MSKRKCTAAVYAIRHRASGKAYVGSSVNVERRWRRHREDLSAGRHHCAKLQRAWLKYGGAAFEHSVLEECEEVSLRDRERAWIHLLRPVFNGMNAAAPGVLRHSEEARRKMSEAQRRHWQLKKSEGRDRLSEEHRHRIAAAHVGKKASSEARKRMSESARKRGAPVLSAEARQRGAAKQRGRVFTEEQRARLRQSRARWLEHNTQKRSE